MSLIFISSTFLKNSEFAQFFHRNMGQDVLKVPQNIYKQCISSALYKRKPGSTKSMAFVIYKQTIYFACSFESFH